jgi:hypothetical protein
MGRDDQVAATNADRSNLALGERRAGAALAYMVSLEFPPAA